MLFKLSLKNIKKSIKDYSIYFFTLVIAVAIFYIFNSIDAQTSFLSLNDSKIALVKALMKIISYVSVFVSFILGFLIIYSNNFLIKRRKKEIGLYLTLGMSKRKVSIILVLETMLVGIISLGCGILLGIFLSQLLSVAAANLFEVNMSSFKFVFSSTALVKSIIYFGIIFILVILFNVAILSRYKLIDLLNASKKNEVIKIRNKYLVIISFILACVAYYIAYKSLFNDAMFSMNNESLKMIISGAIGTLLFYFSISGFVLWIFKKSKKVYYNKLNMFVLKQVDSRMNSTIISTTIITLMLLLTIGILSGSISLSTVFNQNFKKNNLTDFSIKSEYYMYEGDGFAERKIDFNSIMNLNGYNKYVKNQIVYNLYNTNELNYYSLMSKEDQNKLDKEYGKQALNTQISLMKESDYISLLKLYGMENSIIDIDDNEFLELCNVPEVMEYLKNFLSSNGSININNYKLYPAVKKIQEIAIENSGSGNIGVIVVSDKVVEGITDYIQVLVGNYVLKNNNLEEVDTNFKDFLNKNYSEISSGLMTTKVSMKEAGISVKVLMTYLGLYLGIIFAISSVTVLAIKELSESSDNKERYRVLRLIGADERKINGALFTQIAISFMIPLVVALIHGFFGLREVNKLIKILGSLDLTSNILLTSLFIIIIYGGYFLATYLCSKSVIKE